MGGGERVALAHLTLMLKKQSSPLSKRDISMTIQNLAAVKQRQIMAVPTEAVRAVDRTSTTNNNNNPNKNTRISFSVASLLADTRPKSKSSPIRDDDAEADRISPEIFHHHQINPHSPLRQSPQANPELPGQKIMRANTRLISPSQNASSPPLNLNNSNNTATPPLMTSSDEEYEDSVNQEDSIVDVEDLNIDDGGAEDGRLSEEEMLYQRQRQLMQERSQGLQGAAGQQGGAGPIRPTPFSALAAAAAAAAYQAGLGGHPSPWGTGPVMSPFGPTGPMFQGPGFPVSHLTSGNYLIAIVIIKIHKFNFELKNIFNFIIYFLS